MKVALLLAGEFRGDTEMVKRHKELIGEFDTYVACLPKYRTQWEESEWNPKEIYDVPMINFVDSEWAKYRNASSADQSGFWQYWNLCHLLKNVSEYDFYIKSRNDLVIESKLNIDFNTLDADTYYYSERTFCGILPHINDQFWIGSNKVIEIVAKLVDQFYLDERHSKIDGCNEHMLHAWLQWNNIKMEKFSDFIYSKNHNGITIPSGESGNFTLENI
jgi:hypothetical protein